MSDKSDDSDKDYNNEDYEVGSEDSFDSDINDPKTANEENEQNTSLNDAPNESNRKRFVGPAISNGHDFNKELVCVKYPGNVVNADKAIETLGGLVTISETVKSKNRRLELRFRPDDAYCKPACGDRQKTAGFLLRVRIKKSRREKVEKASQSEVKKELNGNGKNETDIVSEINGEVDEENGTEKLFNNDINKNQPPTFDRNKYENLSQDPDYQIPKLKVLGRVDSEFRFTNLCDFQYLPITKNLQDPTKDECIYDSIYPVDLPKVSWLKKEVPYFLPPAAFSRMDSVQPYAPKTETQNLDECVIGKTRKRRAGFSNFISFNAPRVPANPPKGIETAMKVKFLQSSHVARIRQCFEERPIWSKTALMYVTKFSNEQMKILLPSVAYYFMTGPWRITWVKLGYDPRIDPSARIYQVLDYRLKAMHGLQSNITCKRNYSEYTLPYKNAATSKAKAMVLIPQISEKVPKPEKMMSENVYIYRPGVVPPSRQMFYQYCDIRVDEIQENLAKYINPPPGTRCNEKTGWLSEGFDGYCREIINRQVRRELQKILNIPENISTSMPRKNRFAPTGKSRKRYNRIKKEKPAIPVPTPSTTLLEDIPSEEGEDDEWNDFGEEDCTTANESDMDADDNNEVVN